MAMGVPGCPLLAASTASIESVRIVLIANCSIEPAEVLLGFSCVFATVALCGVDISLELNVKRLARLHAGQKSPGRIALNPVSLWRAGRCVNVP